MTRTKENKKLKVYTIAETTTKVYVYKAGAYTEDEAIKQVKEGNAVKDCSFTLDLFYQIEN